MYSRNLHGYQDSTNVAVIESVCFFRYRMIRWIEATFRRANSLIYVFTFSSKFDFQNSGLYVGVYGKLSTLSVSFWNDFVAFIYLGVLS